MALTPDDAKRAPEPAAAPPEPESDGSGTPPAQVDVSRRRFLATGGAAAAGLVLGGAAGYALRQPATTAAPELPQPPLRFLSNPQFNVVEAMAERIFPADADGPGAKEARVASYIDGQLAGGWGRGEKMYRQGPFLIPTDSGHGWQFAMTPQDVYKDALASIDAYTDKQYSKPFHRLTTTQQDDVLKLMADGKIDTFTNVTSAQFFGTFRQNVVEGLFSDPSHGGNYKVIGWRWVGFPGSPMAHGNSYEKHIFKFERYPLEPKPLA